MKNDKRTERREAEKQRLEWTFIERENNMLNTPKFKSQKFRHETKPLVFPTTKRQKKQPDYRVVIYQGMPSWLVILLLMAIVLLMIIIVLLIAQNPQF